MCGISGITTNKPGSLELHNLVEKMVKNQTHRGPDHDAVYVDQEKKLGFGHNRLAIIDLSADANQPMVSQCGRYRIVYNGEIYNYKELISDLRVKLKTTSDTEVLLELYAQYGKSILHRLNGMFAFAIHDTKDNSLFLARDRIGKKPLVYAFANDFFAFASELSSITELNLLSLTENTQAKFYSRLRNFLHVPEPFTIYNEINRLEPSHYMIVRDNKIIEKECYWTPDFRKDYSITATDLEFEIRKAVKLRLRADVEIGCLLSGGVDSSIIAECMVKEGVNPKCYTLISDDEELDRARAVAHALGVTLKEIAYNDSEKNQLLSQMFKIYGEEIRLNPLAHAATLYKNIQRDNIKVVMSGIGADEIFFGYNGANKQRILSDLILLFEKLPSPLLMSLKKICGRTPELKLAFDMAKVHNNKRKSVLYKRTIKSDDMKYFEPDLLESWAIKTNAKEYIDVSNWIGLMTENSHSVSISCDLPPMTFSIEARAPFLDVNVLELAFKTPTNKKVKWIKNKIGNKIILKRAFQDHLPASVLYGIKKGFGYALPSYKNGKGH